MGCGIISLFWSIYDRFIIFVHSRNRPYCVEIFSFSEKLIKTCSEWDTLQLSENRELDGVSGEHRHMLAYRIIFLTDDQFDLKCVKIARQGNVGDETTEPYEVIPWNTVI